MQEFISRAQNAQTGCFRLLDGRSACHPYPEDSGQTKVTMKTVSQASNMMML